MASQRVVVVTGGTSGIGRQCVVRFAGLGTTVLACDVDERALDALTALRLPGVTVCRIDVRSEASVQACLRHPALADGIDVLVNCAGIQRFGDAEHTSLEAWNDVLAVNVTGAFLVSREAVPLLRRRGGGAIVNVSSIQARVTAGGRVAYVTSKAALLGLTRAMAMDHAADGIRVNVVLPGAIETPMLTEGWAAVRPDRSAEQMRTAVASANPLGRVGTPGDVVDAIVYLASPAASFVTGAELVVDGGITSKLALPVAPAT